MGGETYRYALFDLPTMQKKGGSHAKTIKPYRPG